MQYTIRHVTKFTYDEPISESVMEARMQPRSEAWQHCLRFGLSTTPSSRVRMYQDPDGNIVHHFNIPGRHSRLTVTAEAFVEVSAPDLLPGALPPDAWERIDQATATGEFWESLNASPFARRTELLDGLGREIDLERGADPLATISGIMSDIFRRFEYAPQSTRVDSPIDDALASRKGVCQDFAHIMIALVRQLGIPCRYVSGYLFQPAGSETGSIDGATHAWIETWLPDLGWVGFDPTHNTPALEHHIRVAVGRDYADVPPTRGVFKGLSAVRSELAVGVSVGTTQQYSDPTLFTPWMSREAVSPLLDAEYGQQQQQQQQQQQ
jgi:transglutaminase-like putative cysteine protease